MFHVSYLECLGMCVKTPSAAMRVLGRIDTRDIHDAAK